MDALDSPARARAPMLLAVVDLTRFTARVVRADPDQLAASVDDYYHRVDAWVTGAGGRVVKFIGDGALAAFPEELADAGVTALLDLKRDLDAWLGSLGWDSRAVVRAHFGRPVAGPFGPERRFDVIGADVNILFTMASQGFALTAEAFRTLRPETRQRFKKHTPPVTYIPVDHPHPHRTGRPV